MKHMSYNIIITDAIPQDSVSLQKTRIIPNGGGRDQRTTESMKMSSADVATIVVLNRSTPLPAFGIRS